MRTWPRSAKARCPEEEMQFMRGFGDAVHQAQKWFM